VKHIVVCCDGTWNSPDKTRDGQSVATNIVKLAEAVPVSAGDGTLQRVYYDTGVGTSGGFLRRAYEGLTGGGLSRNVLEAYRYLARNYAPGDRLFFFGFSRGAFTVRSLYGLIRNCGVLRTDALDQADRAYDLYRARGDDKAPSARESVLFRRTHSVEDVTPLHFIGVFDTVGALGNPLRLNGYLSRRHAFHDTTLSSKVANACQALAIDEKRRHFRATLWHQRKPVPDQTIEQLWFAGVHSNVGGGYPATGLSDLALEWMAGRAQVAGLELTPLSLLPDFEEVPEESRKGPYRLIPAYHRPIGAPSEYGATHEQVHESARDKYARDAGYRPPRLTEYLER
jgi:uncharacterized protein (DUF2235 family)